MKNTQQPTTLPGERKILKKSENFIKLNCNTYKSIRITLLITSFAKI